MGAKLFGQFLLERGAISRDQLLEAVKLQKSINLPLAALAVEQGFLTRKQLMQVDEERRKSDAAFMEIAMKTGIMNFDQLEALGKQRSERWVFLGEALVQKGNLTLTQLDELVEEYRREQSVPDTDVLPMLTQLPERDVVYAFIQVTVDLFLHYTKQMVKVLGIEAARGSDAGGITYVFSQKVTGEKSFCYAMAIPEELTLSIASHMLQETNVEISAMVLDAVSEFVNVVIGNGCTKLNMKATRVSAEPPQVMMNEMLAKMLPKDAVAVKMNTAKGEFQILFFFAGADGKLPSRLIS